MHDDQARTLTDLMRCCQWQFDQQQTRLLCVCVTPFCVNMQDGRATVVVVGAGVAGLTAANRLRQLGIDDVLVVEAADHVGGRIKQVEGVLPWPVELGPEFVHGAKSTLKVLRCGC